MSSVSRCISDAKMVISNFCNYSTNWMGAVQLECDWKKPVEMTILKAFMWSITPFLIYRFWCVLLSWALVALRFKICWVCCRVVESSSTRPVMIIACKMVKLFMLLRSLVNVNVVWLLLQYCVKEFPTGIVVQYCIKFPTGIVVYIVWLCFCIFVPSQKA